MATMRADQGEVLLEAEEPEKRIWAIAGGKGGTGKTVVTANLGIGLSLLGYKVILIDGDLGAPNLHFLFGISKPERNLSDFINGNVMGLEDVLLPTPNENLRLICGGSEMLGLANLPYQTKQKLKRHIAEINADYIIVDLGAGMAYNTLDFFINVPRGDCCGQPGTPRKDRCLCVREKCGLQKSYADFFKAQGDAVVDQPICGRGRKGLEDR